jgi:hypothetical protein
MPTLYIVQYQNRIIVWLNFYSNFTYNFRYLYYLVQTPSLSTIINCKYKLVELHF